MRFVANVSISSSLCKDNRGAQVRLGRLAPVQTHTTYINNSTSVIAGPVCLHPGFPPLPGSKDISGMRSRSFKGFFSTFDVPSQRFERLGNGA